jgi:hypothetical protein
LVMGEEGEEGPGNDQPTLSTQQSVKGNIEKERSSSLTRYPASAALGLDVGRRRAHKGTQGDGGVPGLVVREAPRSTLLMCVSGMVRINAKERRPTMMEGVTGPLLLLLLLLLPKQEKRARSAEEKDILRSS